MQVKTLFTKWCKHCKTMIPSFTKYTLIWIWYLVEQQVSCFFSSLAFCAPFLSVTVSLFLSVSVSLFLSLSVFPLSQLCSFTPIKDSSSPKYGYILKINSGIAKCHTLVQKLRKHHAQLKGKLILFFVPKILVKFMQSHDL